MAAPMPDLALLVHNGAVSSLRRALNQEGRYSQIEVRAQLYRARSLLYLLKDSLVLREGAHARLLYQVYDQLITLLEATDVDAESLGFALELMTTLQGQFEGIKRRNMQQATRNRVMLPAV